MTMITRPIGFSVYTRLSLARVSECVGHGPFLVSLTCSHHDRKNRARVTERACTGSRAAGSDHTATLLKWPRIGFPRCLSSAGSWSVVRRCTYPSIHFFVSKSRSVVDCAHIQASTRKLADMLDSLVHAGNTRAVGTSTRADACACAGVPQPCLFEFTSL